MQAKKLIKIVEMTLMSFKLKFTIDLPFRYYWAEKIIVARLLILWYNVQIHYTCLHTCITKRLELCYRLNIYIIVLKTKQSYVVAKY